MKDVSSPQSRAPHTDDLVSLRLEALARVRDELAIDLGEYREENVTHALQSRLAALGVDGGSYLARLRIDRSELDRLVAAVCSPTTEFFRDAEVFAALRTQIVPALVRQTSPGGRLRAWSVGASSGEEAWSIAMLLHEAAQQSGAGQFGVLGTDINEDSLRRAREAHYSSEQLGQLPADLRAAYLQTTAGDYDVSPHLRNHVEFAVHDVTSSQALPRSAVLASFQLVLLRNVLIYFGERWQNRAIQRVAAVLDRGGVLVLGRVERIPAAYVNVFEAYPGLSPTLHIFRKRA